MSKKKKILVGLGIFLGGILVGTFVLGLIQSRSTYEPTFSESFGETVTRENPLAAESLFSSFQKGGEAEESGQASAETPSRLVIKTGSMNIVVENVSEVAEEIIQYAEDEGGWVVFSSVSEREEVPSGRVQVRVPAANFDETISHFRGLAKKVTYEETRGRDVTEEYTDLEARLRNLEATESQLLKIMEKSWKVEDALEVQRELTKIREQIETTKGRMQYLERSVEMATITVNLALSEELLPIPEAEKWRPIYVLKRAWRSAQVSLREISYILIWIIIYGAIWIPLGAIVWGVRKLWKRLKRPKLS